MPPSASVAGDFTTIEFPYDSLEDVGGIEVEAVEGSNVERVTTKIRLLPRDHHFDEQLHSKRRPISPRTVQDVSGRYAYFGDRGPDKCLADSFDSVDEIEENSHEAKLIKSIAENASIARYNTYSGLAEPEAHYRSYSIDSTEAKYLDVLDRHLFETNPELMNFDDLHNGPDDSYPGKNQASVEDIFGSLLDSACCECVSDASRLKSALRPSKWTFDGCNSREEALPHSVQFKNVDIREFKMTLGNHPSATSGPPVMLDWESEPETRVLDLETYERARQPRRKRRQLKLSLQQRHNILVKERGFSFEQVKGAWQEALEIRKQRKETLERGLALMKWDEVWESTCRKFNRIVDS